MRAVQVNTKFLNGLPPEWSKFVTDVKLARDLHTTNYDQLYSYLEQHEVHANETRLMCEHYQDPLAFVANYNQPPPQLTNYHSQYNPTHVPQQTNNMIPQVHSPQSYSPMYPPTHPSQPQINHLSVPPSHPYQSHQTSYVPQIAYTSPQPSTQPLTEFPQLDSGLAVPVFNPGDDPIACLNKAMAFLIAVASLRFPSTNNQLRTSSNLRNQATIQDGRVNVQQVQGRQGQSYAGNSYKGNATSSWGNNTGGQARVVKCYNFQGEGHMARQCTQPKRTRNAAWFKEKEMLDEALEAGQILDEEQLAFLADPDNQITGDSNIIPYSQYLQETQLAAIQDTDLYAQQDSMISVIEQMSEQMINHVIKSVLSQKKSADNNMYDGVVFISDKHVACSCVCDDEETLILARKMLVTFCLHTTIELSDEQAFWLQTSHPNTDQSTSLLVKIEAPRELSKVCLVNTSLKKLKYHLGQFDNVVKKRITPDALTEGEWGESTNSFNHIEAAVQQYFVDKKCFEIQKKEFFLENNRLLQKIMSQDVMLCVMHSTAVFDDVNVEMESSESCVKCMDLDAELLNKQIAYNDLLKSYSQLEKHCISLELTMQLTQEIFQKDSLSTYQMERKWTRKEKVKPEMDEIETINTELEHSVAKLLSENEHLHKEIGHLKKIYKDKFGKEVENATQIPIATTVAPGMFKLNLDHLAPSQKQAKANRLRLVR
ncbi:integrase, catalytic region, zinc finger, CCHC-type containing protein [Tanacetum coccineum]